MDNSTGQPAEDSDPRRQRIRRAKGGVAASAGLVIGFVSVYAPWLHAHFNPSDPKMVSSWNLNDLSTGYAVYITLGLLVAIAVAATSRRVSLRRAARRFALPAYALAVVAVLNTAGMIRWWGGPLATGGRLDEGWITTPAWGVLLALASAQLLAYGAVELAPTTPPALRVSEQDLLDGSGFRG